MLELVSKLKISVVVVERATGELLRMIPRKSGDARTGVKAEDKRGGGGKGNWGTFEDDAKEEDNANNTSAAEVLLALSS